MITEIVLFLLLVITLLFLKVIYAPPRPQGTFPSERTVSARSRSETLPETNVRRELLVETTSKINVSSGYKSSPSGGTSITVGSQSETPFAENVIDEEQHDSNIGSEDDSFRSYQSNRDETATDTHHVRLGSDSFTEPEENSDSNEEDDDTINEDDNHEQKIFEKYVDRESLECCIKNSGRLCGLMDYISDKKGAWKKMKLNIAVAGNSGAGKSSLINAIMNLRANEEGAAKVGITETTTEMKQYPFPGKDNLVLWDLPGMGTQTFKTEEYLSKFDPSQFEVLIIVSATRFTENDIWLAKELLQKEKHVFFVRTKIDIDLKNEKHDYPYNFNARKCLRAVKDEIKLNLKQAKILSRKRQVYVVSSRRLTKYDFKVMLKKLTNIMNNKGKYVQKHLERYMTAATENMKKWEKEQFVYEKIVSAIAGFLPIRWRNIHVNLVKTSHKDCKRVFCMTKTALQRVSDEVGIPIEQLKEYHLKYFRISTERHRKWFEPKTLIFLNGYRHFSDTVNESCDILAEDECTLIHLRIKKLDDELLPM